MISRVVLVTAFLAASLHGGYAPNLPSDPDFERLAYRLSSLYGLIMPERFGLQPYTFTDASTFLQLADSSRTVSSLSICEKLLLAGASRRFGRHGLVGWEKAGSDLHLKFNCDLLGDVRPGFGDSATLQLFGIAAPSFAGNMGNLSFYSGVRVWTEYRSDTLFSESSYQPYDGVAYNLYGRKSSQSAVRSSDLPRGGVRYEGGRFSIETAIDHIKSGPARLFPLTLSGTAPPVTYFRGSLDLEIIDYTHLIGLLKAEKDKRKYIFMHRLSSGLWKRRVQLGINEVIVYGNTVDEPHGDSDSVEEVYRQSDRALEWVYCIPLLPFKFVEHYAGDRDNAAISIDFNVNWPAGIRWYAEFFLDDMLSPLKLFTRDWGNKWALTAGFDWYGRVLNRDFSLEAEYSRIEPWVYTHFGGASHRYTHFNASLGSPLGPNSQAAALDFFLFVHPLHEVGFGLRHSAFNRSVRGGNISDVFQHVDSSHGRLYGDSETKRFLGPGTSWFLQPVVHWNFNAFGRFSLRSVISVDLLDKRGRLMMAMSGGLYL